MNASHTRAGVCTAIAKPGSSQQGKKNGAQGAIYKSIKKLGNRGSHAFKHAQGPEPIRSAHSVKGAVDCGNGQRADTSRARALGINHFGIQGFVAQARQASLDVQVAAFGVNVLFGLYARLHRQGNSCAGSQRQARSNHGGRHVGDHGKRGTGAADQLHEVDHEVDVFVIALAGQVKPVAIVSVEDQVITHEVAFVWPRISQYLKTSEAVEARVVADRAGPEFSGRANQKLSLWASRKSDIESVETFNVAQQWMPAISLVGGAA